MASRDAPTNVRDRFLADHRSIEDLLGRVLTAFERNDRSAVATAWTEFDARLLAHLEAEERYLIPALSRVNERAARAIIEEHKHLRGRLTELGAGVDLHIVRLDMARQFIEDLRAHARHEDRILYRWADEHFSETERAAALGTLVA